MRYTLFLFYFVYFRLRTKLALIISVYKKWLREKGLNEMRSPFKLDATTVCGL